MKNTLFISLLILTSTVTLSSQNNLNNSNKDSIACHIKNEKDSFTGKKIIETGFVYFGPGTYLLSKTKGIINFWIQLESYTHLVIEKGEIFYIKFEDNSVMKLINNSTDFGDYSTHSEKYLNSFSWNLTSDKLLKLRTKKIIGIKCYISEYDVSDSEAIGFINNLNCIFKAK